MVESATQKIVGVLDGNDSGDGDWIFVIFVILVTGLVGLRDVGMGRRK